MTMILNIRHCLLVWYALRSQLGDGNKEAAGEAAPYLAHGVRRFLSRGLDDCLRSHTSSIFGRFWHWLVDRSNTRHHCRWVCGHSRKDGEEMTMKWISK